MSRTMISTAEMGPVVCNDCRAETLTLIVEEDDTNRYERIVCECGHESEMPPKPKPTGKSTFVCLLR